MDCIFVGIDCRHFSLHLVLKSKPALFVIIYSFNFYRFIHVQAQKKRPTNHSGEPLYAQ